jgi:hypothetical protein
LKRGIKRFIRLFSSSSASISVWVDHLEPPGFGYHALQAPGQLGDQGVVRHAFAQVLRLAHIEGVAPAVEHAVDTGRCRQGAEGFAQDGQAARERRRPAGFSGGRVTGRALRRHGRTLAAGRRVLGTPMTA